MQTPCVVDIDGGRAHLEDFVAVVEAEDVLVCPVSEAAVFGEAVATDSRTGEDHVAMGGAHLDGVDDFDEINAVALRK